MITTPVLAETGWVVMAKLPVNPTLGTVTLGGTLAIAGLLLERATTAPPSGAGTLRMTVPDKSLPPTTLEGLMSRLVRVAGGRAACLEATDGRPGSGDSRRVDPADSPEVRCGRKPGRRIHRRRDGGVAHERRCEGTGILDLNAVGGRPGGLAPVEGDRLRRIVSIGGSKQRWCGWHRRWRGRRRGGPGECELGHERIAPEDGEVAVEDRVERADRRREVDGEWCPVTTTPIRT